MSEIRILKMCDVCGENKTADEFYDQYRSHVFLVCEECKRYIKEKSGVKFLDI